MEPFAPPTAWDLWILPIVRADPLPDDGGEPEGFGDNLWGTRGILASRHLSCKGGSYAYKAAGTTVSEGSWKGWALIILTSVNPCASRVGWLLVANLTGDNVPQSFFGDW
jgi:hypothetical protein